MDHSSTEPFSNHSETVRCALFGGDHSKCLAIIGVRRAMSVLSIIGCLFVIFLIWLFRKYVAFAQRLILYLSITGVFYAIALMAGGEHEPGPLCTLQGFGSNILIWAMLLWVCCITFNLYMNAIWMRHTEKFEWAYCLVAVGIPIFVSCLPFSGNHYGPAASVEKVPRNFWIVNSWGWRFGIWYFPLFCLIFTMICAYIHIIIVVNRQLTSWGGSDASASEQLKNKLKLDIILLKRYPLIYICCSIFALINRIQNSVDPDNPVFALMLLHALTAPLPGPLNAVVFCLDKETSSKLTWSQIKLALYTKTIRRVRSQLREYNPYQSDPVPPDLDIVLDQVYPEAETPATQIEGVTLSTHTNVDVYI